MKTLYFSVDTTGRYLFREPVTHPDQPHLARLAWVVADEGDIISEYSALIRPQNGWIWEDDAIVAHGITPERALADGVRLPNVMGRLVGVLDDVPRACAFNMDFAQKVLQRTAFECGLNAEHLLHEQTLACAMRRATDIVRKPRMEPGGGWSWPKFREAYEFFSDGEELPSLDMDPIARGIALARCVYTIDQGILSSHRSTPNE